MFNNPIATYYLDRNGPQKYTDILNITRPLILTLVNSNFGQYQEVKWGGLSPSAGAAALSMRIETTTNSAPPAAVTLSKQRPRPSLRMIHCINTINPLYLPLCVDRRHGDTVKFLVKSTHRAQTHSLGCSPSAHSQLFPRSSAKPMFTFTNPPPRQKHSNVAKSGDSLQLEGPCYKCK